MDTETVMRWVTLGVLVWFYGAGSGWWRGPIAVVSDVVWDVRSRHLNRRSDPDPTSEDDTGTDVETTPREGFVRRTPGKVPAESMNGPQELAELRAAAGIEDDVDPSQDLLTRREWVAWAVAEGWRPKDIDEEGAALYGCSTQTIFRDRKALAHRSRGTMGGKS